MTKNRVVIDRAGFYNVFQSENGAMGRELRRRGQKLVVLAKRQVGVKTGALRTDIGFDFGRRIGGDLSAEIGSKRIKYARAHHEGASPHEISARPGGFLRFPDKYGAIIFRKSVNHPGNDPNRFLTDNLRRAFGN